MNFYQTLKISETASAEVVNAAYNALSKSAVKFQRQLDDAYFVLSDSARRRAYDAHRYLTCNRADAASNTKKLALTVALTTVEKSDSDKNFWDHSATRICANVVKTLLC